MEAIQAPPDPNLRGQVGPDSNAADWAPPLCKVDPHLIATLQDSSGPNSLRKVGQDPTQLFQICKKFCEIN